MSNFTTTKLTLLKEGSELVCTKTQSIFYTVGKSYKVLKVDKQQILLEDNMDTCYWPLNSLNNNNYETQFELLVKNKFVFGSAKHTNEAVIKKGVLLECTKAVDTRFYTVGKMYTVLDAPAFLASALVDSKATFTMTDDTPEEHGWDLDTLNNPNWDIQFKLVEWV